MRKTAFLNIFLSFTLFFLLIIIFLGCSNPPPSDFFRELTSVAATKGNGSSSSPMDVTEAPTQSLPPTSTTIPEKCRAESKNNNINIRSGPSGNIIGCCLAIGENVEIQMVDASREWALIKGIEKPLHLGWVKLSFLKIIGDCKMVAGQ